MSNDYGMDDWMMMTVGEDQYHRMLHPPTVAPTAGMSELTDSNDSATLRNTLRLYGTLFVGSMVAFCYLRRKFPHIYNLRSWVEEIKTDIAEDQFGFVSWMWKVFLISDTEMLNECGMDALCYARVLEFGFKLALVGMLQAVWLIPVYATAPNSPETDYIRDRVVSISVAHLPTGSYRFIATVVAAYMVFGYTMMLMLSEFEWFIMFRHQFLAKKMPRNYSVYVQNIPEELCTDRRFLEFFEKASDAGQVLSAHICMKAPNLKKKVTQRAALVTSLEHAINVEEVKGVTPMKRSLVGPDVNAIDALFEELQDMNEDISQSITDIDAKSKFDPEYDNRSKSPESISLKYATPDYDDVSKSGLVSALSADQSEMIGNGTLSGGRGDGEVEDDDDDEARPSLFGSSGKIFSKSASQLSTGLAGGLKGATDLINKKEDGERHTAGFVQFKTLRATQSALQMLQYPKPFGMEVLEAPQAEDTFWMNIGKTHYELQMGRLLSFGLTAALCLFWTIPMAFINSLSSIDGLRDQVGFIDKMLTALPWLVPVFAQLAPLLVVFAQVLLKIILEMLSWLEGPISGSVVQASLFSKIAAFMIIQTFFVSTLSGGLMKQLGNIAENPSLIVSLLAKAIPPQSTFFIQILLVDTSISMITELLRVIPVAIAFARSLIGPKLTEKERNTTFMGLRPFCDPAEFQHADLLASSVLYFMVFFVYCTLAPITTFFLAACFLLMGAAYRHQLVYIYPTFPDSGGYLWTALFKLLPTLMITAELVLVGLLALNQAAAASAMMFPLLIITFLFSMYIQQKHFQVAKNLPARECIQIDRKNNAEGPMSMDWMKDAYRQPELTEPEVYPENATVERQMNHGCVQFFDTNVTEAELEDLKS